MFATFGCRDSAWTTFATADENDGCSNVAHADWISTLSRAGISKLPSSRICSARRDSPFAIAQGSISRPPTAPDTNTMSTPNAIQPKAAVFQWAALQRPARPARFVVAIANLQLRRYGFHDVPSGESRRVATITGSTCGKHRILSRRGA